LVTRREFLDTLTTGAAGLAIASSAKSYGQILGANERLNFAIIGLNGRAYAHLFSLKANKSAARISHVCDVDANILKKFATETEKAMGEAPATDKDFRSILQLKEIDAITIATPDHWHANGHCRPSGGQACVCRKAVQPQSGRGRAAGPGAKEIRQAGTDGHAATLFAAHH
jgi:hypothetical protein